MVSEVSQPGHARRNENKARRWQIGIDHFISGKNGRSVMCM